MTTYTKDPDAVLDYGCDWSDWLAGDTIATSAWYSSSGLTIDSDSNTTTATTVWVSGGIVGRTHRLTNRITTAAGRTEDRTLLIVCAER